MRLFARRKESGWVACVPSGTQARFALVERGAGAARPRVRWVHEQPWTDAEEALRAARRAGPLARHRCVALLQRNQYQLLPMDAPDVPRAEWRAALRWALKDMVDFPVADAGIDVLALPPEAGARRRETVIAVAAPGAALRELIDAGAAAGVDWAALDVPETALRNLGALLATPGRAHGLLHMGAGHGTLVLTLDGELLQSRQIDVSAAQLAEPDAALRQQAFDRAGLELQRTLDGFERAFAQVGLERLHVLPGPGVEPFCDYVRELLYVPVLPAALGEVLDFSAVPALAEPQAQAPYLVALGAALRED